MQVTLKQIKTKKSTDYPPCSFGLKEYKKTKHPKADIEEPGWSGAENN